MPPLEEALIRLGCYLGVFLTMALLELRAPRRVLTYARKTRWPSNLGVTALNTLLLRLIFPSAVVGMAWTASERGFGLLNHIAVPFRISVIGTLLVLDLVVYLQHVLLHAVPALWRLHMVHHADLDFDVTTGTRFHPLEMLLSTLIKIASVAALGPPIAAVFAFEVILNATSVFNHSNVRIPTGADRVLRWLVVTPDMHRVHHSLVPRETNSNFGFNVPWWDRLLGTYRAQPAAGHERMTIGVRQFRDEKPLRLSWMLILPFVGDIGNYSFHVPERELDERPYPRAGE